MQQIIMCENHKNPDLQEVLRSNMRWITPLLSTLTILFQCPAVIANERFSEHQHLTPQNLNYNVALCYFQGSVPPQPQSIENMKDVLEKVDQYIRFVSYEQASFTTNISPSWEHVPYDEDIYSDIGYLDYPFSKDCNNVSSSFIHNHPDAYGTIFISNTNPYENINGHASLFPFKFEDQTDGFEELIYTWLPIEEETNSLNFFVSVHEIFHNLGLRHPNIPNNHGISVLGHQGTPDSRYMEIPPSPLGLDKYRLGWIPEYKIYNMGLYETQDISLNSITEGMDSWSDGHLIAVIKDEQTIYGVEYRTGGIYDNQHGQEGIIISSSRESALSTTESPVYTVNVIKPISGIRELHNGVSSIYLRPGETYELEDLGVFIYFEGVTDGQANVKVSPVDHE